MTTGATAFVDAIVAAGARFVFGNPGTTEQAFIDALGGRQDIELVVALHEAVAVGAAEGYARVTGRPAVVQLHTRGGLGNAMGMLSNADTGRTPLVVYVGGASRVGAHTEPALGGDLVAMAAPVSRWAWEVRSAAEIPTVVARAFKVATTPPYGPVVLAVPNDVMDDVCDAPIVAPSWVDARVLPRPEVLAAVASRLSAASSPAIVIGDGIRTPEAGAAVSRLASALGAPVHSAYLTQAVLPAGENLDAGELPLFDVRAAAARLAEHDLLLAIGADLVRSVFPRPGAPLPGQDVIHVGSDPWELGKNQPATAVIGDEEEVLGALCALLDDDPSRKTRRDAVVERLAAAVPAPAPPSGRLDVVTALRALAGVLPDDAVLVDESVSAMPAVARLLPRRPGRWFRSRGGALGAGMSVAVGAGMAGAGPVVALVGDGSAMYTITSLWTAARRRLPVTWVILDNGGYRILEANTRAWRGPGAPDRPFVGTALDDPRIDVAAVAAGFGVRSWRVERLDQMEEALAGALAHQPSLVHIVLEEEP